MGMNVLPRKTVSDICVLRILVVSANYGGRGGGRGGGGGGWAAAAQSGQSRHKCLCLEPARAAGCSSEVSASLSSLKWRLRLTSYLYTPVRVI